MAKKVLVALPLGLLEQVDFVAQAEQRNRSDLVRESLRRYIQEFNRRQAQQIVASDVHEQRAVVLSGIEG